MLFDILPVIQRLLQAAPEWVCCFYESFTESDLLRRRAAIA